MFEENLARLIPVLDYARRFPHVKIHMVPSSSGFERETLALLGIHANRVVRGNIHAHIAIIPDGIFYPGRSMRVTNLKTSQWSSAC